jgi:hypothetical protein
VISESLIHKTASKSTAKFKSLLEAMLSVEVIFSLLLSMIATSIFGWFCYRFFDQ